MRKKAQGTRKAIDYSNALVLEKKVSAMVRNEKKEIMASFLTYGTLGIEMGVSLAIGLAIGYYLDRYFGTGPILTLIFMVLGLVAGMKRLYELWKKMERDDERDDGK
jgi:ATP synthase protein I